MVDEALEHTSLQILLHGDPERSKMPSKLNEQSGIDTRKRAFSDPIGQRPRDIGGGCLVAPARASRKKKTPTCIYVSIRQHTSAYIVAYIVARASRRKRPQCSAQHTSAYVSIRQHTSAYVSIRQHTSAYVSIHSAEKSAAT